MPDRFIPLDTMWYTPYYRDIIAKGVMYRYVLKYLDANRDAIKAKYPTDNDFAKGFEITPDIMQGLITAATNDSIAYNEEQFHKSETYMRTQLKALLARDIYENGSYFKIYNEAINPTYKEALRLINNKEEYNKLLKQ